MSYIYDATTRSGSGAKSPYAIAQKQRCELCKNEMIAEAEKAENEDAEICEGCGKLTRMSDMSDVMTMWICNTCEEGMEDE